MVDNSEAQIKMREAKAVSSLKILARLWQCLSSKRKRQIIILVLTYPFAGFVEVVGLGAVLPFLSVLIAPESVFKYPIVVELAGVVGITNAADLVLPVVIAFCLLSLFAAIVRIAVMRAMTSISLGCGADLCLGAYTKTLHQPYATHISRHSSNVILGISNKVSGVGNTLLQILLLINSGLIGISLTVAMFYISPVIAASAAFGFGGAYVVISVVFKRTLYLNGRKISEQSEVVHKSLQEGLGSIRDILVDGTQQIYANVFKHADHNLRKAQGSNAVIAASPRFVMEALGIILIAMAAYFFSVRPGGVLEVFPVLAAFALGAQRLLPAMQQSYSAIATIMGSQAALSDALVLLEQPMPAPEKEALAPSIAFNNEIKLESVCFKYPNTEEWVLNNASMTIPRGARVALIGTTGSGKSTLLDVLLGLLQPVSGRLAVDGLCLDQYMIKAWQKNIAHVPQFIYLTDASIAENIAFGVTKDYIDMKLVYKAADQAQISGFIDGLPDKFDTRVGERGARLSGGQRQRIGIARALYKQAKVILLDEATSALDEVTESSVMQTIEELGLDVTIVIIAHRLNTVQKCDQIFELLNGEIHSVKNTHLFNQKN
jgi:ABC-type multidrug transport system fused ATPase/permease subunit